MGSCNGIAFRIGLGIVIGGLFVASPNAMAQDARSGAELQEVIVTAERVQSSAQRTAISMEVLDSDKLKSEGVTSIQALSTVSPSVHVTGYGGGTVITVRGISSRDTTEIGDPAVVVSHDGFYQDRSYALGLTQYDLERIEILRGPQGTLYGRNATGGAINIYTTRPGKEAGGYVQVDAGNYGAFNTEGAVNLPLSDRVQMRASFGTSYHDGYRGYSREYGKVDDANARSGRLQFAFQPTENFDINVTAEHTVQTALGNQSNTAPYQVDANGWVVHTANPAGLQDAATYTKYVQSRLNLDDSQLRYDLVYRAPWATVTYLGGYDSLMWDSLNGGPNYIFAPATTAAPNPAYQNRVYNQTEKPETINQELRFTSPSQDSRLTWQAGVYYFRNKNALDSFNFAPNGTQTPTPVIHFVYDVQIKSLAEMAQLSFKLTDTFKFTGGFRHNADDKDRSGWIFFAATLPPGLNPTITNGSVNKNTYHLGLDWQMTPDSLIYAKYSTGYKSGGFTDIAPYGPETVKTAEIGTKNRLMDNKLQLNFDIYNSDYTGQQVQQIVQGGGGLRIVNAGSTKLRGAEGELIALLPIGQFDFSVAYLDAEFKDFKVPPTLPRWTGTAWQSTNVITYAGPKPTGPGNNYVTASDGVNFQLAGNVPQQAPKWTFGAGFEHRWRGDSGTLTGRISSKYQSKQYYTFFNRPDDEQGSYALTNLSFTYEPAANNAWRLQAYVNNVTDEEVFSNAGPNDRAFQYAYTYLPPRTWGGRLTYRW